MASACASGTGHQGVGCCAHDQTIIPRANPRGCGARGVQKVYAETLGRLDSGPACWGVDGCGHSLLAAHAHAGRAAAYVGHGDAAVATALHSLAGGVHRSLVALEAVGGLLVVWHFVGLSNRSRQSGSQQLCS